jgi:hypothetical protein
MAESILALFAGCAVTGALAGVGFSVYLYFSPELASLFPVSPLQAVFLAPVVMGIGAIAVGTIPFMCFAAFLRKVWSPSRLKRAGFTTGLLLWPAYGCILALSSRLRDPCDRPACLVALPFVAVAVLIASHWAVAALAQSKAWRSEAGRSTS